MKIEARFNVQSSLLLKLKSLIEIISSKVVRYPPMFVHNSLTTSLLHASSATRKFQFRKAHAETLGQIFSRPMEGHLNVSCSQNTKKNKLSNNKSNKTVCKNFTLTSQKRCIEVNRKKRS